MTSALRPTLVTVATCFVAQTALASSPGYVAPSYSAETVLDLVEEGTAEAPARSLEKQLRSKRRSKKFDRMFDDTDRRAFRQLRRLGKTRGRNAGRVLRQFPPPVQSDVEKLMEHGAWHLADYLVASGLKPTRVAKYSLIDEDTKDADPYTEVADRSHAYVRVKDGKLRDVYVWAHTVEVQRSVYESRDHMLFVYRDDGRLDRMYRLSRTRMGIGLMRFALTWGPNRVVGIEMRSADGSTDEDPINFYRIERLTAPTIVAQRR